MVRIDPKECPHSSINRVLDSWLCNDCGTEFVPVDKKLKNPWKDTNLFKKPENNVEKFREVS